MEIVFLVSETDGGLTARSVGAGIFTEAATLEELRGNIREAVACHFEDGQAPTRIRLQIVREEVLTV